MPLFEVKGLCVDVMQGHLWQRKRRRLLHEVSFAVASGEAVAYLGPNGAGKTTTFRAIFGLASRSSGELFWKGRKEQVERLRSRLGFLPEQPYFSRTLTPREWLAALGRMAGMRHDLDASIARWAARLAFEDVLDRPMRVCSKGQLQRVGLALALMHEPEMVVLDEPMSGLDPVGRELVKEVIKAYVERGKALLFSSHILADAESICDRVIALNEGRIIFDGRLSVLLKAGDRWHIKLQGPLDACDVPPGVVLRRDPAGVWELTGEERIYPFLQALDWARTLPGVDIWRAAREQPRLEDAFLNLLGGQVSHA